MTSRSRPPQLRVALGGLVAVGLLSVAAGARAEPPPVALPEPPPVSAPPPQYPYATYVPVAWAPRPPATRVWYGWQTLIVSGSSLLVGVVTGIAGDAGSAEGIGVAGVALGGSGLVFGGPIVHWAHGRVGRGFAVLGMNFGAAVLGAGVGFASFCAGGACNGSPSVLASLGGFTIGGGLAVLATMAIDVSLLSYEPTAPAASSALEKAPGFALVPDIHISREKTTFGVAGVF